jgi:cytochrome P450
MRVREAAPLCRIEPYGFIGITRYNDVVQVLKNPRLFSSTGTNTAFPTMAGAELFTSMRTLIGQDPPEHSRVRRLIQRAFTLQEMQAWEPRVASLTRSLVEKNLLNRDEFDFIGDFAMPLPVTIISKMLGVDPEHAEIFKRWSDDMISIRSVHVNSDIEWRKRREQEIIQSCKEFTAYFDRVIKLRREKPGSDLISAIIRAADQDQIISASEILSLTRLMLVAGNETTTNLLGNAITALLRNPDQWQRLVENPQLSHAAVEEALRYDSPVLQLIRRVTETTKLAGETLPEGTFVAPLLASANRDPRHFINPDSFDIGRDDFDHLAFGLGIHLCVGAPLARIEARIALCELATHLPNLALTEAEPEWLESLTLRGHRKLGLVKKRDLASTSRHRNGESGVLRP